MRTELTKRFIANLQPPADRKTTITWDTKITGLGLRVSQNDVRTWVLVYRVKGTGAQRTYTIGRLDTFDLAAARKRAKALKQEIAVGGDPHGDVTEERRAPDMNELLDLYIEKHLPRKREASQRDDKSMIERELRPALGTRKVSSITFSDIDSLHRKITKRGRPYRANRTLALASKIFALSIMWGMRTDNPCRGVEKNDENRRTRYLTSEETTQLTTALAKHNDQQSANVVRLALLTGARRGEILAMRWPDVDFAKREWTKPSAHTKQKREHRLPLSAPTLKLLSEMREKASDAVYVFPPTRSDSDAPHQVDVKKFWERICKGAGLDGVRFHDLRHHHASLIANQPGASLLLIGQLLGHTQPATTARYAHLFPDTQKQAVEAVGAVITAAESSKPSATVHKLPRRRK